MDTQNKTVITITATVNAPVQKAWDYWTQPEHIIQWNSASSDWHTPRAENDLRVGGKFSSRMEAKDGSMGFDFGGMYDVVTPNENIEYTLGDGRKVATRFTTNGDTTSIEESFDAENENPVEMQRAGWQAILDSFKKYSEEN